MITVKDLVIGVTNKLQIMINKAFMKRDPNTTEGKLFTFSFIDLTPRPLSEEEGRDLCLQRSYINARSACVYLQR
jgi:hypothetical protein